MANHSSSKKAIRQIERRTEVNRSRISRVRTFIKKAEVALGMHKTPAVTQEEAKASVLKAESEIMRAVSRGMIHQKTASRKISRLIKRVKALTA